MDSIVGTGKIGTGLCRCALTYRAPLGKYTLQRIGTYATQTTQKSTSIPSQSSSIQSRSSGAPIPPSPPSSSSSPGWINQQTGGIPNADLVKYSVPAVVLLTALVFSLRGGEEAQVQQPVQEAAVATPKASSIAKESYTQIGSFVFHQREVEEAFIANPDQFIYDVIHLSADLEPFNEDADNEKSRYRALCLFTRNILLTKSACTSDVLKIARIHFEKAIKAEKETVIYQLVSFTNAVQTALFNSVKFVGAYISGYISRFSLIVKDEVVSLWNKTRALI